MKINYPFTTEINLYLYQSWGQTWAVIVTGQNLTLALFRLSNKILHIHSTLFADGHDSQDGNRDNDGDIDNNENILARRLEELQPQQITNQWTPPYIVSGHALNHDLPATAVSLDYFCLLYTDAFCSYMYVDAFTTKMTNFQSLSEHALIHILVV